ncbi:hypothetical protein [Flavobacterium sp. ASW18X]|uniref:hypothetical protein n=1 Tax=Flavobacterium sp. ASW18X TaxID=2572595 RepID=UPI0010ADE430|nr:hypothetical protein [Flavobacterium sp. ASW18X]TKD63466.1 hypothetical protein FBT53_08965 [Flavobacterium sp. ASW18X]
MYRFQNNLLTLFILLCAVSLLQAQKHEFLGVLTLKDTVHVAYRLQLELKGEKVSGFSVTDLGGAHETKSYITGNYYSESNTLKFQEYGIEYTKSDVDTYDFCFVHFSGKVSSLPKENIIQGQFVGRYDDGFACLDGELNVKSIAKIYNKAKRIDKKIQKAKVVPDSIKAKTSMTKTIEERRLNMLKANEKTSIFINANNLHLTIFDAGKIDGDVISVYVNNEPLVVKHVVGKKKRIFTIPLKDKVTTLRVVAENEGEIVPNTAKIEISEGSKKIDMLSNLKKGESTQLVIHKLDK